MTPTDPAKETLRPVIQTPSVLSERRWIASSTASWGGLPAFSGMFGASGGRNFKLTPHVDVRETDKEIVVEAELPGIDEKDISLAIQDGVLTIRGEKRFEHDEEKENYRMMERRYGSFQRSLRLPESVDDDKVEASFDNGVLKVSLPKRPEAIGKQRTIPIKKG